MAGERAVERRVLAIQQEYARAAKAADQKSRVPIYFGKNEYSTLDVARTGELEQTRSTMTQTLAPSSSA